MASNAAMTRLASTCTHGTERCRTVAWSAPASAQLGTPSMQAVHQAGAAHPPPPAPRTRPTPKGAGGWRSPWACCSCWCCWAARWASCGPSCWRTRTRRWGQHTRVGNCTAGEERGWDACCTSKLLMHAKCHVGAQGHAGGRAHWRGAVWAEAVGVVGGGRAAGRQAAGGCAGMSCWRKGHANGAPAHRCGIEGANAAGVREGVRAGAIPCTRSWAVWTAGG